MTNYKWMGLLFYVSLISLLNAQDALISPYQTFEVKLSSENVHEQYLVEIDLQRYQKQWSAIFVYAIYRGNMPTIDIQFKAVLKAAPQQEGASMKRCRMDEISGPYCKLDTYGLNFQHYLFKMELDCVESCTSNITIGFTKSSWDGSSKPELLKGQLAESIEDGLKKAQESERVYQRRIILAKILGWMLLTLLLVLAAIQFAVKVADYFQPKMNPRNNLQKKEEQIKRSEQSSSDEDEQEDTQKRKKD